MARERKSDSAKGGASYRKAAGLVHLDILLTSEEREAVKGAALGEQMSAAAFARERLLSDPRVKKRLKP